MPFSRATAAETNGSAADNLHAESAGALGHFKTDAAQAENAERLAAQLRALQVFLLPLAGVHGGVGRGQFARQGDHQADGQFGDGDGIGAGRIHHHDAAARGGLGVDVVHAHAGAANDAQLGRVRHQRVVDLHGAAHHKRVGIGQRGGQAVGQLVVRQHFPSRLGRKHGQRCRRNFFRQNDLHGCSLVRCCADSVVVKTNALLLAEQVEHAHHRRMRLAFAALVLGERVGMHAQPLGHFVLKEIELLARDQQLFSETQFRHEAVLSSQLQFTAAVSSVGKP